MNVKTINLTGSEVAVNVGGYNAEIKNNGTETIYASAASGIVAGADGVVSIPTGASVTVTDTRGTVYIIGTGSVEVVGKDFVAPVFNSAAAAGGVGENLLINPDFAVNQRTQTSYSASGYTVDRWKIGDANLTVNDGFVTLENTTGKGTATFYQIVENPAALSGKTVVLSFDYDLKTEGAVITIQAMINGSWSKPAALANTGRNVKSSVIALPENLTELRLALIIHSTDSAPFAATDIYGAKLELGKIATPIVPADPAAELTKCQRYYQLRSTGDIAAVDMRPVMATIKDIKQREDGYYEYIAEL